MMTFDRMRVTGDTNDLALNQTFYLLYAYGGTVESIGPLNFSQHTTQGVYMNQLTLSTSIECPQGKSRS